MESIFLNKLSAAKKQLIGRFLSEEQDDFELAASYLKTVEKLPHLAQRSLKIVKGPTELRELLQERKVEQSNTGLRDDLSKVRVQYATELLKLFKEQTSEDEGDELRKMIFWDLNFQLSQAIYSLIGNSSLFKAIDADFPNLTRSGYSFNDADWLGFYKIFNDSVQLNNRAESAPFDFIMCGGFDCFFYGDCTVVLRKPCKVKRNQNLVLHCEDGPAVEWKDGTRLYYWNGIEVTESLILRPETVTREDILSEKNVEVRRCFQEALGSERFAHLLGLTSIDEKQDRFGNTMILYRTNDKDKLIGEYIHFAKVICPTTGRNYFLCVPPRISSVEEAVAWTFGKRAKEYKPERET